ncbi:DUF6434 domain-containing protein [Xylocopilactobacillus apis]|uniref:DUF6434 domain-containing protein n=1 Tax=Xylocopilactobacillus apis TaxID=2932183 RepID=A0AAU9D079_9LACO|nr:DUF6434 domain-containing protein [Xylocopilactobacillus apis]BDR55916.1 hypothetical protein KIMC2_04780 [Xylocopilactobacillus apis]
MDKKAKQSRPELRPDLNAMIFLKFYYLKEELVEFCRLNQLSTQGSKTELTDRVAYFLETGLRKKPKRQKTIYQPNVNLTLSTLIEKNISFSEKHRVFFKQYLGDDFHFNVKFKKWLRSNSGKTYQEAIDAYKQILFDQESTKIYK